MTAPARLHFAFVLVAAIFAPACQQEDASQLPEWTPKDHTNQNKPSAGQIDTSQKRAGMEKLEKQGVNDVVFAAWKANCVRCHGTTGRGDGAEGRMVKPPDMTNPSWHRGRIDSEMKRTIQQGRGRMPSFGHLPEPTVDGLIQLVKMLNPEFHKKAPAAPAADGNATPTQPSPNKE